MTTFINALLKYHPKHTSTKKNIDNEIRRVNLIRSFIMTGLAIPVALILSFTYSQDLESHALSFIDWQRSILDLNFSIVVISAVLFVLTLIAWSKPKYGFLNKHLPHVILLVMGVWGTICCIYNSTVSTAIVTFLLICVVSSISLLIHPIRLLIYLLVIYFLFFLGISNTLHDSDILVSNLAIGLVTLVACLGLSVIQRRSYITQFEQKSLIKTQKKELEENYKQLLVTSDELQKANQTKDQFFSILAHDLRGPISSTLALTMFLEESFLENDEEERKRLFKLLQSSLETSSKLLENVLLWSRSQTGNMAFNPIKINLSECIQSNIDFLKIVAAQKDIKVKNHVDSNIVVLADADMMNTIFRNLISNAIKFTRNFGNVDIKSALSVSDGFGQKMVYVSVIDDGVGMTKKLVGNLFEIEKKSVNPGTNNEMGTGLGLVLCNDFVQKHGGTIEVESSEKIGSTFTVSLPLQVF